MRTERPRSATGDPATGAAARSDGGTPSPELVTLQAEYRDWLDTLPPSLENSATAEALRSICDLDLSGLESAEPPRGFGRDV